MIICGIRFSVNIPGTIVHVHNNGNVIRRVVYRYKKPGGPFFSIGGPNDRTPMKKQLLFMKTEQTQNRTEKT